MSSDSESDDLLFAGKRKRSKIFTKVWVVFPEKFLKKIFLFRYTDYILFIFTEPKITI